MALSSMAICNGEEVPFGGEICNYKAILIGFGRITDEYSLFRPMADFKFKVKLFSWFLLDFLFYKAFIDFSQRLSFSSIVFLTEVID